jgi:hypothetical protein
MKITLDQMNNLSIYTYSPTNNMNNDEYYEKALEIRDKKNVLLQKALVSAIAETTDVHADSNNPFHKSKYASLNAHLALIKPIFAKYGLAILQFPCGNESAVGINTIIIHNEGGRIEEQAYIPCPQGIDAQKAGSVYSYLRRYSLAAVAGVATDDDDANIATFPNATKPTSQSILGGASASAPSKFVPNPSFNASAGEVNFDLPVPFGKNKGSALKDLPDADVNYWANTWEPKPWEKTGKVGAKDLALKASAKALWAIKQGGTPENEGEAEEDAIPF